MSRVKSLPQEKELKQLLERFDRSKVDLQTIGVFRRGSITKRWMTCGNSACLCRSSGRKRHGPYYWWTTKVKGQTQAILVPKQFLSEARTCLRNYKELKGKLKVLSQLSERIIRKKLESLRKHPKRKP